MEQNMQDVLKKAEVLIEALPYIQKFNRKIIVVKYGGSAMSNEELQRNVIKDVTLLKLVGFKPVIVHGGGKEISKWVKLSGKEELIKQMLDEGFPKSYIYKHLNVSSATFYSFIKKNGLDFHN